MKKSQAFTGLISACVAVVLAVPGVAHADGGQYPSQAPTVDIGAPYFGDNRDQSCTSSSFCRSDFWRLPALLAQDVVTIAWRHIDRDGPKACLTGNVDDYDWLRNGCNLSEAAYGSDGGSRSQLVATTAASPAYLQFYCTGGISCSSGPYEFTVESIQHALGLSLKKVTKVKTTSKVTGYARLSNGEGAPNGLAVNLVARVGKSKVTRGAVVSNGTLTFNLNLPRKWRGKVVALSLVRAADEEYLVSSTKAIFARIL